MVHQPAFMHIDTSVDDGDEEEAQPIEIETGDVVAFSGDLVHRSLPNESDKPRITGVLRVIDMENIEEYRPLYKALSYEE
jgi:ectoine hydroxylase-related dioxygenase (phytanoyl-CoA dioxygenase family)